MHYIRGSAFYRGGGQSGQGAIASALREWALGIEHNDQTITDSRMRYAFANIGRLSADDDLRSRAFQVLRELAGSRQVNEYVTLARFTLAFEFQKQGLTGKAKTMLKQIERSDPDYRPLAQYHLAQLNEN